MENKLKIVLLTIDKAGEVLIERLAGSLPDNITIELVVTRKTRAYDFNGNPVVNICKMVGVKYIQPNFKNKKYLEIIQKIEPDLIIICNFHKIIKNELIQIAKIGTFNLHSSLLPKLRGGTSIIWALKNNLEKTGVTLHCVTEGVDDGDIISQKEVNIDFWDTQGSLYEKITVAKYHILLPFLKRLSRNEKIIGITQNEEEATHFPKRKDSDGELNLESNMLVIYNHIRSFDPWTGTYISINGLNIRLRKATAVKSRLKIEITDTYIVLSRECNSGVQAIIINSVTDVIEQPELYDINLARIIYNFWKKQYDQE